MAAATAALNTYRDFITFSALAAALPKTPNLLGSFYLLTLSRINTSEIEFHQHYVRLREATVTPSDKPSVHDQK